MLPWHVENEVDDEPRPADFSYLDRVRAEPGVEEVGCDCGATCGPACPCAAQHPWGHLYGADGCLVPLQLGIDIDVLLQECGPGCSCQGTCVPPPAHQDCPVHIRRIPRKGWGVIADCNIPCGAFVCEYVGERVTTAETRRRLRDYDAAGRAHALLVFREILPSQTAALRINIDATRQGNVAAFINHSCDGGNLILLAVLPRGCMVPSLRLFARRNIEAGEELTYSYGTPAGGHPSRVQAPCLCGTPACRGFLPRDPA
ncbi:hypothetical protein ACKKBG_A09450 [Auxenochlorella protothecoides x Auxenochlorella symbiontica]